MDDNKKVLLRQQLLLIKANLNDANNEFDNLKASIKAGIMVNNEVIGSNDIMDVKKSIESIIDELSDIVLLKVE